MLFEYWIKHKIMLLNSKIGPYRLGQSFFFEPDVTFYDALSCWHISTLQRCAEIISSHIGIKNVPLVNIVPDYGSRAASIEYDNELPILSISEGMWKDKNQIAAALAHELTHQYMYENNIFIKNKNENELFTDFTTIFLGLGKILANGSGLLASTDIVAGYMKYNEIALCIARVLNLRGESLNSAQSNLKGHIYNWIEKYYANEHKQITLEAVANRIGFEIHYDDYKCFINGYNPPKSRYSYKQRVISCKNIECGAKMKIPVIDKDIEVTCPKCKTRFIVRTNCS